MRRCCILDVVVRRGLPSRIGSYEAVGGATPHQRVACPSVEKMHRRCLAARARVVRPCHAVWCGSVRSAVIERAGRVERRRRGREGKPRRAWLCVPSRVQPHTPVVVLHSRWCVSASTPRCGATSTSPWSASGSCVCFRRLGWSRSCTCEWLGLTGGTRRQENAQRWERAVGNSSLRAYRLQLVPSHAAPSRVDRCRAHVVPVILESAVSLRSAVARNALHCLSDLLQAVHSKMASDTGTCGWRDGTLPLRLERPCLPCCAVRLHHWLHLYRHVVSSWLWCGAHARARVGARCELAADVRAVTIADQPCCRLLVLQ